MNAERGVVGFVGIGNMGWPMAACLLRAGYQVLVSDLRAERVAEFVRQVGGSAPGSLRELAAASEVVITMLPTSKEVAQVLAGGADNLLAGLRPGSTVIDTTSGVPATTQALAAEVAAAGSVLIDAPVSGGVARAVSGELAIMVGGEPEALECVRGVLEAMGATIRRCGGVGAGQAMKALNNLVSAGGFLIGVEALLIGAKFGLDPALMTDVLNASTGMNNSTQKKFHQFVLSREYASGFGLDLMVKDLSIALAIGREAGVPAPLSALCRELWAAAATLLGPGQDHTAMAKFSEALARLELH